MRKEVIVTNEYFLCLHEIGGVKIGINSSAIEPCPRHMFAPSAHYAIAEGEVIVFAVKFLHMSLHYRYSPAEWQFIMCKNSHHILVPEILPLRTLLLNSFEISERNVCPIAKVEIVVDDSFAHSLNDLLIFGLIDRTIEKLMLEGNVLNLFDAVYLLCIQCGYCLYFPHDAQIWLLVYYQNSHH